MRCSLGIHSTERWGVLLYKDPGQFRNAPMYLKPAFQQYIQAKTETKLLPLLT